MFELAVKLSSESWASTGPAVRTLTSQGAEDSSGLCQRTARIRGPVLAGGPARW